MSVQVIARRTLDLHRLSQHLANIATAVVAQHLVDEAQEMAESGHGFKTPEEQEIIEESMRVGEVVATSWLEFLVQAVAEHTRLELNTRLLPRDVQIIDEEKWRTLDRCVALLAIDHNEAHAIRSVFCGWLLVEGGIFDLPFDLMLHVRPNPTTIFVVTKR